MTPESTFQTTTGTPRRAVLALSKRVNNMMDMAKLATIIKGRYQLFCPLAAIDPPTIMGISGRMQGAITVSTPAKKETMSRVIAGC
jgi:hypothetical protein